ncbi:MAG TPA: chorismate mutase, partial [Gammaproteobacteria bacterium]|nr:chorismate mutase [Gammaproteobacteria bacterium]
MSDNAIPAELLSVREKIDAIDERLLDLLAERFQLT